MATRRSRFARSGRAGLLVAGFLAIMVIVLGSPLLLAALSGTALPWGRLADVGDAFEGASALLSAIALCGIGASLLYQQRQVRQELAGMDRQQHAELLKLALDNPEFMEMLNGEPAGPHARQETYANLTMMYWLAIWELGEIDDDELRLMVGSLFRSDVARRWWARVGAVWIGTRHRPERVRFLSIISAEHALAQRAVVESHCEVRAVDRHRPNVAAGAALAVGVAVGLGFRLLGRCQGRRRRSARMSSIKRRHVSRS
ncbi:DUF6082 family protein [Paractinoplanes globisporus]|uniref:DUF6082 family protein n=1 Tax=Paractinoplanes globisporus TaxID=113565 RepID=A0ABW6WY10_9ACTN|nr:DUF6082 family protein [Actinoplanes globisporus]